MLNAMEMMKQVNFDMNYRSEYGTDHTVHVHIKFGDEMAEASISVDKNRKRDWIFGFPYDQPNMVTGPVYYTHEDMIWLVRRAIKNDFYVEGYLEDHNMI